MNRNSYLYQSCTLSLNNNKVIEEEEKEERDDMISIVSVDETIDHSSKLDNLFA